MKTSATWL